MILMAKAGIAAEAVAAMPHAELAAWFDDILLSLGVKKAEEGKVINSKRQPRPAAPKDNSTA